MGRNQKRITYKNKNKSKGGDIDNRDGLKHILSIGYEFETGNLAKLTKTDVTDNSDEIVLYNTDTARKDIVQFQKLSETQDLDLIDDVLLARMEETINEPALNNQNREDPTIIFNITSDQYKTPFIRALSSICDDDSDKNELYFFKDENGEKYRIHFIFRESDSLEEGVKRCGIFSDVEWIFTYLKPRRGPDIIVNTFSNALMNLIRHLSNLNKIRGEFIFNSLDGEMVIDPPQKRNLYNKPNTNLYYLQTQMVDREFDIDDVCFVPQMTFSCEIQHIITVCKTLVTDNYLTISRIERISSKNIQDISHVEMTIQKLIENYNATERDFQIIKTEENASIIDDFVGYLFLFMYKLFIYYNNFIQIKKEDRKYFKNSLTFNCRHQNNVIYEEMKKILMQLFTDETAIPDILKNLIVQEDILTKYFIRGSTKLRKHVFNPKNILEKNTSRYGDPVFSLMSYMDFFENPTDNDTNVTVDEELITNDWFGYAGLDVYSTDMPLDNNIVFVEFRGFPRMVSNYLFNLGNDMIKDKLSYGSCQEEVNESWRGISIGIVKHFLKHKKRTSKNKTRKLENTFYAF